MNNATDNLPWEDAPETEFVSLGVRWRVVFTDATHVFIETVRERTPDGIVEQSFSINGKTYGNTSAHFYAEGGDGRYRDETRTPSGEWRGHGVYNSNLTDSARKRVTTSLLGAVNALPDLITWRTKGVRHNARRQIADALDKLAKLRKEERVITAGLDEAREEYWNACAVLRVSPEPYTVNAPGAMVERIHEVLLNDGEEWDSGTIETVASVLTDAGYRIPDPHAGQEN